MLNLVKVYWKKTELSNACGKLSKFFHWYISVEIVTLVKYETAVFCLQLENLRTKQNERSIFRNFGSSPP